MLGASRRAVGAALLLAALAFIGAMTLVPVTPTITLPATCIICGPLGGVDFLLNVVLFVPLGFGALWYTGRLSTAVLRGFQLTVAVELLQWVIPGRFPGLGDIIANTLGAWVGAIVALRGAEWLFATGPRLQRLSLGTSTVVATGILGTTVLLLPDAPSSIQQVQWAVTRTYLDTFPGRLRAVELNGQYLRPAEGLWPSGVVDSISRGTRIRALVDGPVQPTRRQAIILRTALRDREGMWLGQWRDALTYRTYQFASRVRLRSLMARLDGAFPASGAGAVTAGSGATIGAHGDPAGIRLYRETTGHRVAVEIRRTPGLGWTLLLPWDIAVDNDWLLANAIWLAALVLPAGYFGLRSRTVARWAYWWLAPALVAASLAATPLLAGTSPLALVEWIGVASGFLLGFGLARLTSDRGNVKA